MERVKIRTMDLKQISQNIFKKKSMDDLLNTSKRSELKKTLNVFCSSGAVPRM